jgi:hypothetical protein
VLLKKMKVSSIGAGRLLRQFGHEKTLPHQSTGYNSPRSRVQRQLPSGDGFINLILSNRLIRSNHRRPLPAGPPNEWFHPPPTDGLTA